MVSLISSSVKILFFCGVWQFNFFTWKLYERKINGNKKMSSLLWNKMMVKHFHANLKQFFQTSDKYFFNGKIKLISPQRFIFARVWRFFNLYSIKCKRLKTLKIWHQHPLRWSTPTWTRTSFTQFVIKTFF